MWGVPEVLDQVCMEIMNSIIAVVHPDFHQVCPGCDVPLGPKLRYSTVDLSIVDLFAHSIVAFMYRELPNYYTLWKVSI